MIQRSNIDHVMYLPEQRKMEILRPYLGVYSLYFDIQIKKKLLKQQFFNHNLTRGIQTLPYFCDFLPILFSTVWRPRS